MPREIIPAWSADEEFHVKVGWAHGQEVQVGVEGDEGRSLYWLLLGSDDTQLAKLGTKVMAALRQVDEAKQGDGPLEVMAGRAILNTLDTIGHYEGVWSTLDRHGCNRLIRTLRKARDAAFGRDE